MLADTACLDTLSERDFRAGYAEVVKYGLIGDRGFFEFLEANWREVFAGGPARVEAIAMSCAAKARVVAADETEQGRARAAQSRPHFRACFGEPDPLRFGAPRARRGRRDRHGLALSASRAISAFAPGRTRRGSRRI